jgi:hypothetical protein
MSKSYAHRFPVEVYWLSRTGETHSNYFATIEQAEKAIERAIEHNKQMGYAGWDVDYRIRPRIPITRKGSGKKAT